MDIRKNFQEGRKEGSHVEDQGGKIRENPDNQKMTSLLQGSFQDEAKRINQAFELMPGFQSNLNEAQKKKLIPMISKWD